MWKLGQWHEAFHIQVYNNSLEKQVIYNNFDDFCVTFLLSRGKSSEEEESNIVGEFKVSWTVSLHEP